MVRFPRTCRARNSRFPYTLRLPRAPGVLCIDAARDARSTRPHAHAQGHSARRQLARNSPVRSPSKRSPPRSARGSPRRPSPPRSTARSSASTIELPDSGEAHVKILTDKDPEALGVLRHSAAHIMARAVMRLFDGVQLAFGPTIDERLLLRHRAARAAQRRRLPGDRSRDGRRSSTPTSRSSGSKTPRDEALADRARTWSRSSRSSTSTTGLADHASLSFYRQGEFIDLCRGPHIPSAGAIGAFKLLSHRRRVLEGRRRQRQQLQRLYGTAFFTKEELDAYLAQVEEAKRRDHRVLGKQLELFTISQEVGPGLILWMPKGAIVRAQLEEFIKDELTSAAATSRSTRRTSAASSCTGPAGTFRTTATASSRRSISIR